MQHKNVVLLDIEPNQEGQAERLNNKVHLSRYCGLSNPMRFEC